MSETSQNLSGLSPLGEEELTEKVKSWEGVVKKGEEHNIIIIVSIFLGVGLYLSPGNSRYLQLSDTPVLFMQWQGAQGVGFPFGVVNCGI